MDLSGPNKEVLLQLMSAAALRGKVLANNIANQNVPGFKRQDVKFEDVLAKELERATPELARVEPQVVTDMISPARADGNNVEMEHEMTALRENRLAYELYAALLSGQSRLLQSAIHGDR